MRTALLLAALVAASATAACTRDDPAPAPTGGVGRPASAAATPASEASRASRAPAVDASASDELAAIAAAVKLVGQEYALAVDDAGAVKDDTELAEAELFADQATLKYQRLAPQVKAEPAAVDEARAAIAALADGVARRRPPAEVSDLARAAAQALSALGPAESAATAGLRAATEQADRAIESENTAGDYRVGVYAEPPRRMYRRGDGGAVALPSVAGATSYLGVVLRETRTKRFLPDAVITAEIVAPDGRSLGKSELVPLWGDFPQYGANLADPGAPRGTLVIGIEPPHHARHGDMLGLVAKPARTEFAFEMAGGRPAFTPGPPIPVAEDYAIGDDILMGLAESRTVLDAGGYRMGFIAEAPEPIWLWRGGPELEAVRPEDTHHLEVLLQDRASGLLVPSARVSLTLVPKGGGEPIEVAMHSLLSAFQHYGETLRVPPGDYRVRVDVEPPSIAVLDVPRFLEPARAELDWRAEPASPPEEPAA